MVFLCLLKVPSVLWSGLTDGVVGVSVNLPEMLSGLGDKMAHPVTSLCSACIRWKTRFTRRADMDCSVRHRSPLPGCFSASARGLSWKLGLSSYNKSLIIRIMEGRNGWRGSVLQPATDVAAPSPRSRQPREIIKCHHGEREYFE